MNEKEKMQFAENHPQSVRKFPQEEPAKKDMQLVVHESEFVDFEIITDRPISKPDRVPFEINIPVPSRRVVLGVLKYVSMATIAMGVGYGIWLAVLFVVAWVYTPLILISIAVFLFLIICFGSLSRKGLKSQDHYPSRHTTTSRRNVNITNIIIGDGNNDITNIIN